MTMSQGWRKGHQGVPAELHHRPLHLIKHMRQTSVKASDISDSMIKGDGPFRFLVTSASRRNVLYRVFLGNQAEKEIPSCNCMAFARSHLPCKHMVAIFNHTQYDWESLPDFYKNHPLFCVDDTCVQLPAVQHLDKNSAEIQEDNQPSIDAQPSVDAQPPIKDQPPINAQPPIDEERNVASMAKRLREVLNNIVTLSYCATSADVLCEAKVAAEGIYSTMLSTIPKSGGFVEERETNPKKPGVAIKPLPNRRKRKCIDIVTHINNNFFCIGFNIPFNTFQVISRSQ